MFPHFPQPFPKGLYFQDKGPVSFLNREILHRGQTLHRGFRTICALKNTDIDSPHTKSKQNLAKIERLLF